MYGGSHFSNAKNQIQPSSLPHSIVEPYHLHISQDIGCPQGGSWSSHGADQHIDPEITTLKKRSLHKFPHTYGGMDILQHNLSTKHVIPLPEPHHQSARLLYYSKTN